MINKIMKMDLAKSANKVGKTAQKLNDKAIDTTENLIDETLAVGEQWQAVMEKALHAGVDVFAKQQDMTLTALETVKEQYLSGNDRLVKLLGLEGFKFNQWTNTFFNRAKKASATAANKVSTTILKAEEKVKSEAIKDIVENNKIEAVPTVIDVAEKAAKTVEVAAKEATKAVKKTVKATTATAKKGAKATATTAKKTAKKSTAKVVKKTTKAAKNTTTAAKKVATAKAVTAEKTVKVATAKVATAKKAVKETAAKATKTVKAATPKVAKDKLTLIEGIGPKIEEVLNATGIMTFQHLSTYTAEALENILVTANPRYKRFQPTTWAAQAKFAAEGKMEELKAWQDELNGGKIVK